ncbi:MAG: DUF4399 domain-containing protein [Acidimicrobiales bacterium]
MTTPAVSRFPSGVAFAVAILLTAAACGGGEDQALPSTTAEPAKAKAAVEITAPGDGSEVASPVKVTMSASELTIEPAGAVREGAGHFHVMVDVGCVPPGDPIPLETAGFNHFGKAQTEAALALAPGKHTLCLQAGNGAHTALDLTDEITVTVTGG